MTERRLIPRIVILLILAGFAPLNVLAQNSSAPDSQSKRIAALEQQAADAKSSADNAWMLTSSALVLMMTGPGLALFYGGLVRKKNVLGTMMQSYRDDGCDHRSLGDCGVIASHLEQGTDS